MGVYIGSPRTWPYIRPDNLLKVIMLKLCSLPGEKLLRQCGSGGCRSLFCDIVFAGCMVDNAVRPALGRLEALARQENRNLELLFHPGGTEAGEQYFGQSHCCYEKFYRSRYRKAEAETLRMLAEKW